MKKRMKVASFVDSWLILLETESSRFYPAGSVEKLLGTGSLFLK